MKTLKLTKDELSLLLDCVGDRLINLEKVNRISPSPQNAELIQTLAEMDMDLRELLHRDELWEPIPQVSERVRKRGKNAFGDTDMRCASLAALRRQKHFTSSSQ